MPLHSSMASTSVSSAGVQPAEYTETAAQSGGSNEGGSEILQLHSSAYKSLKKLYEDKKLTWNAWNPQTGDWSDVLNEALQTKNLDKWQDNMIINKTPPPFYTAYA